MKFGGIGIPELLIILLVVLLIFGPKNLPKLGSALGKSVKNLREGMDNAPDIEIEDEEPEPEPKKKRRKKAQIEEPKAEEPAAEEDVVFEADEEEAE